MVEILRSRDQTGPLWWRFSSAIVALYSLRSIRPYTYKNKRSDESLYIQHFLLLTQHSFPTLLDPIHCMKIECFDIDDSMLSICY